MLRILTALSLVIVLFSLLATAQANDAYFRYDSNEVVVGETLSHEISDGLGDQNVEANFSVYVDGQHSFSHYDLYKSGENKFDREYLRNNIGDISLESLDRNGKVDVRFVVEFTELENVTDEETITIYEENGIKQTDSEEKSSESPENDSTESFSDNSADPGVESQEDTGEAKDQETDNSEDKGLIARILGFFGL